MVRLEITFITGLSCAASVNPPRGRTVHAHRSIFTVCTLHHILLLYCVVVAGPRAHLARRRAVPSAGKR